ncbi:hypothetical protein RHDC4_03380 [Rhodocyclaceae bacterium]|nr:hypothetical protein RHDC4_03380 [Rhodocyclaceae bacterium]
MVVINSHRTTAIVVRNSHGKVTLVPMCSGRLAARTLAFGEFRAEWHETDYALPRALDSFLRHAAEQGATAEALRGLERLQARDACVSSLF